VLSSFRVHDHFLHIGQTGDFKEHVLSAAKTNTLGAIRASASGILGIIRICPNLEAGNLICPTQESHELFLFRQVWSGKTELTNKDLTGCAIEGDPFALFDGDATAGHLALGHVDRDIRSTNHAWNTKLAGNHRSVRRGTTLTGEDAFGCEHSVYIIRLGEWANHDDILFFNIVHLFNQVGIKVNPSNCRARRGIDTLGVVSSFTTGFFNVGVGELGMQHLVNLLSSNPVEGCFLVDQTFLNHIMRNFNGGFCRTFTVAGLEHPEFVVFNGELNILHVLVMLLKAFGDVRKLRVNLR